MTDDLYNWLTTHKTEIALAGGWFLHKFIPYCQSNGGLAGVVRSIIYGKTISAVNQTTAENGKAAASPVVTPSVPSN